MCFEGTPASASLHRCLALRLLRLRSTCLQHTSGRPTWHLQFMLKQPQQQQPCRQQQQQPPNQQLPKLSNQMLGALLIPQEQCSSHKQMRETAVAAVWMLSSRVRAVWRQAGEEWSSPLPALAPLALCHCYLQVDVQSVAYFVAAFGFCYQSSCIAS